MMAPAMCATFKGYGCGIRALGIAVNLSTKGRPTACCVLVEGTLPAPSLIDAFDLTSADDTLPGQLHDLASGLRSRLSGLKPDRVVVRRADFPPKPSNKEGPRLRLLAEGALIAAAMDEVRSVTVAPGKELVPRPQRFARLRITSMRLWAGRDASSVARLGLDCAESSVALVDADRGRAWAVEGGRLSLRPPGWRPAPIVVGARPGYGPAPCAGQRAGRGGGRWRCASGGGRAGDG